MGDQLVTKLLSEALGLDARLVNPGLESGRATRERTAELKCRFLMLTAGMYERSGEWLYEIGLPGKSGVSGGIVTVAPGKGGLRRSRRLATRLFTAAAVAAVTLAYCRTSTTSMNR